MVVAIPDVHGEFSKLSAVMEVLVDAGFSFKKGHKLIQLGDKNDRGHDTFEVFEYFKVLLASYPTQVTCLWGNHESMLLDACDYRDFTMFEGGNGGSDTLKSYAKHTGIYTKMSLGYALKEVGHYDFLKQHVPIIFDDKYVFCHCPIPLPRYRQEYDSDSKTLRTACFERWISNLDNITWSLWLGSHSDFYVDKSLCASQHWVDPKPWGMSQLFVHGHIHDIRWDGKQYLHPKVRRYGNSILLDTGCGCVPDAPLTALDVTTLTAYNSDGEIYPV